MPDFQQFADDCENVDSDELRQMHKLLDQAAKHARLLQAVWEWANSGPQKSQFVVIHPYVEGQIDSKAHVRSLLQPTEEK